jgi:glyoxylase-like metal-dependent hydrolase (beta-lactamase superfamily II)/SAM-dependent methyltransferase
MTAPAVGRDVRALLPVSDHVLCARGYSLANVIFVLTRDSVVVVDTAGTIRAARASLADFRSVSRLPVSHIIYSHFHGDHIGGARVFHQPSTQVVAQQLLPVELAAKRRVGTYRERVRALQFGLDLKYEDSALPPMTALNEPEGGYVPPDRLFGEEDVLGVGDLTFNLFHAEGESLDHAVTWVPEIGTVFPGDLFYASFPMLSNPMKPSRPVLAWADALDRMRALKPSQLVPSHGNPVVGMAEVDAVLANYGAAIRHVHDTTVTLINHGYSLDEIRSRLRLPDSLAALPYLQERYGTVDWAVTGIYRHYTGWYDMNPAQLHPGPRSVLHRAVLDSCASPHHLVERARRALRDDDPQLALELTEIVLDVDPHQHQGAALEVQEAALRLLAGVSGNRVARRIYAAGAQRAAARADAASRSLVIPPRANYSGVWVRSADAWEVADGSGAATPSRDDRPPPSEPRPGRRPDYLGLGVWTAETRSGAEARATFFDLLLAPLPRKTGNVLVARCGTGATLAHLLNYYPPTAVVGIEESEQRLQLARQHVPSCPVVAMSPTNLDFPDQSFANVVSLETARPVPDRRRFLREAHRVLEPDGRLVVADLLSMRRRAAAALTAAIDQLIDPSEYRELYFDAGFERVEIVEVTHECVGGLLTHRRRVLRADAWLGVVDPPTPHTRTVTVESAQVEDGYYLLVCAQKGGDRLGGDACGQ